MRWLIWLLIHQWLLCNLSLYEAEQVYGPPEVPANRQPAFIRPANRTDMGRVWRLE